MSYEVMQAIITLIIGVITVFLVPYIKTKTTITQQANIKYWVGVAVAAAEQIYKAQEKSGESKNKWVVDFLQAKGFKITENELVALIEATVKTLK